MASHSSTPAYSVAPKYRLPSAAYALIEYPGPVASTLTSQSQAIKTLGGISRLSKALHADNGVVEVNFRPDVTFSHAVSGENITDGCNIILLKVIKKRRRRTDKTKIVGERVFEDKGVYKMEVMGVVEKLVRFRGMADLQYLPPNAESDETVKLGEALRTMDLRTMQQYRFPEPSEDYDQNLHLLPPPVFSRLTLPQIYAYRANPLSIPTTVTKPDGSEVTRLVNKTKYKGVLPITISFAAPATELPAGPTKAMESKMPTNALDLDTIRKLTKLFEERPVWSRNALYNTLSKQDGARIANLKNTLPFVSWTFSDGPFRDSCIRFGYDPRQEPEARFYQRVVIRNKASNRVYLQKIAGAGNVGDMNEGEGHENSHIFDGEAVHRNVGYYQLCDMTDPFLQEVIQNDEFVREECDVRDGWWDGVYIEFIRQILKRKFLALVNENTKLPNEAFDDLLQHLEVYRAQREDSGGHAVHSKVDLGMQGDGVDAEMENAEMCDTVNALAQRKLTRMTRQGKRPPRYKAKEVNDGQNERVRSRVSSVMGSVPPEHPASHDNDIGDDS